MNHLIISILLVILSICGTYYFMQSDIKSRSDKAENFIKKYDMNIHIKTKAKDNELDFQEFQKFANKEYLANHKDTLNRLFNAMDKDKSDKIDIEEIRAYSIVNYYMNSTLIFSSIAFVIMTIVFFHYIENSDQRNWEELNRIEQFESLFNLFMNAFLIGCFIFGGLSVLFIMSCFASVVGLVTGSVNYGVPMFFILMYLLYKFMSIFKRKF